MAAAFGMIPHRRFMLQHTLRCYFQARRADPACKLGELLWSCVQVLARRAAMGAADPSQFLSFLAVVLLGRMEGISACDDPRRATTVVGAAARAVADAGPPGADRAPCYVCIADNSYSANRCPVAVRQLMPPADRQP